VLTSILTLQLSQVLGRGLFFLFSVWFLNRALGLEAKGLWTALFSLFGILLVFANMGFEIWLSRAAADGSIGRRQAQRFLFRAKSGLWAACLLIGGLWAWRSGWSPALALPFGLALIFDGVGVAEQAVYEGKRRILAMAGLTFIKSGGFALAALAVGAFAPEAPLAVYAWLFAATLLVRAAVGWRSWRLLPDTADPPPPGAWREFAAMGAFTLVTVLYFKVDAVMLADMVGDRVTGDYGNAYDFVEGALFFSGAAGAALYPRLVTAADGERGPLFDLLFQFILTAGAAGAVALWLAAPWLGGLLAGEAFAGAVPPLAILGLGLPFMFGNGLLSRWLFACRMEGFALKTAAAMAVFNIAGNWLLIPEYGAEGAAVMTVATEGLLFLTWVCFGRKAPALLLSWSALTLVTLASGYLLWLRERPFLGALLAAVVLGPLLARYAWRVHRA